MGYFRYLPAALLTASIGLGLSLPLYAEGAVDKGLLEKVNTAQQRLNSTEKKIAREKNQLMTQLNKLEQEVQALQQKTASARRLSDEKTLSLNQLEARIKDWREQQVYQQNLLNRFLHQQKLSSQPASLSGLEKLSLVRQFSDQQQGKLQPVWQQQSVVLSNGKIESLPALSVGPLNWFWLEDGQQAGLANRKDGQLHAALLLNGDASRGLNALKEQGQGSIYFDPTMDRAVSRQQNSQTIWQHLVKGGIWVIPILSFAVLALVIAMYKSWQLARLPKILRFTPSHLQNQLRQPNDALLNSMKGQQQVLFDIAQETQSERVRDDQLFMQLQQDKYWLERWLLVIGITASVAPLLGLLGTVSGMIETFKMMTLFGSGDPEVVSGGIAQALITTELGLVVAIPALILHAILSKRARSYYHELESFAILLSQPQEQAVNQAQKVAA